MRRAIVAAGLLLAPATALADPFYVWGERTRPGEVGLNPYFLADASPWGGTTVYGFVGVAPSVDVIVGAGAEWDGGLYAAPIELMPRFFPSSAADLALAAHLVWLPGGSIELGPEAHYNVWLTDAFGLWWNTGGRVDLAEPAAYQVFQWVGVELAADVPFVAVEVDVDLDASGAVATVIPSVGVWVGPLRETGFSAGVWKSSDGAPIGGGLWAWRTFGAARSL